MRCGQRTCLPEHVPGENNLGENLLRIQDLEKSQLELNIKSQQYRIAQTLDEVSRINVNIEATQNAIAALADKIKTLKG